MKLQPHVRLFGETGGKNCAIVTKLADRDLAIKEIVHSAFSYSGQKCSALSLLILEEEVYQDNKFLHQLVDAVASLPCGSAWNFDTKINPLIRGPSDKLKRAMTTLEPGEEWLLKPSIHPHNPHLITPGIKRGVQRGSFTHKTELFGPILGIMCAKNLDDAIVSANMTPYGLTSGLFSLDTREHATWMAKIHAGNCYINRSITGAIVKRQPFGGCKASSFGIGMKAGSENYLFQLLDSFAGDFINDPKYSQEIERRFKHLIAILPHQEDKGYFIHAVSSYLYWMEHHFSKTLELDRIVGEDNFLAYHPHDHLFFYVQEDDSLLDCLLVLAAAEISGCTISVGGQKKGIKTIPDTRFMHLVQKTSFPRFRTLKNLPESLSLQWSERASCIDISKPKPHGRTEMLHYLYEVTLSSSYNRYGNLLHRDHEERNHVL
jgi:RHH-type proline utilization regulon transcriptional repressor/proline dehydrogenase/delta 1-pyrroline-5-carboxylate dehydrogenase